MRCSHGLSSVRYRIQLKGLCRHTWILGITLCPFSRFFCVFLRIYLQLKYVFERTKMNEICVCHYQSFYIPTDGKESYFKKNIKIYIITAPTCFGLITIITVWNECHSKQ